jgi:hypothetical protein
VGTLRLMALMARAHFPLIFTPGQFPRTYLLANDLARCRDRTNSEGTIANNERMVNR